MDAYVEIEQRVAKKYGKNTTTRKAVGDFMLSETHAVNVKSNNVEKENYSPNMISIRKMHKWVYEDKNELSFVFVDYREDGSNLKILDETDLISLEHISWDCLSIEAQGYGVIQKVTKLKLDKSQTKRDFYRGFLKAYEKYRQKEINKHKKFSSRFIEDINSIDW